MTLSLLGVPKTTDLLGLIDVKAELGINSTTYDVLLGDLIGTASGLVYDTLGYSAFRCTRRETLGGSGRTQLLLTARPVLRLDAASYRGDAATLSEISIASADAGLLSLDTGFTTCGDPGEWQFDYLSGWFLPGDDVSGSMDVSSVDNSYNSAALFPEHVIPGDYISASTFSNAANNGLKRVLTATTSKITVEQTLVTETTASRALGFENVPAPLKRAAMEVVRILYRARTQSGNIASKRIDDMQLTYATDASSQLASVSPMVSAMLTGWRAL